MDTVLGLDFDLSSIYTYNPASKSSPALSHQSPQLPLYNQNEISGLSTPEAKLSRPAIKKVAITF